MQLSYGQFSFTLNVLPACGYSHNSFHFRRTYSKCADQANECSRFFMCSVAHNFSVSKEIARARRKRRPCRRVLLFTPFLIRLLVRVLFERYAQRLDEQFVVECFAQEVHGARRQCPVADSGLVVGCDEDDGEWIAATC